MEDHQPPYQVRRWLPQVCGMERRLLRSVLLRRVALAFLLTDQAVEGKFLGFKNGSSQREEK